MSFDSWVMWCWVIWCCDSRFNSISWHFMTSCDIQIHHAIIENPDVEGESGKMAARICIFPQLVNMQISTTIFPFTSSTSRFLMIVCSDNKHVTWCHEMSWGHVTWCQEMSCDVVKMSCNVTWCYENVIECYVMS